MSIYALVINDVVNEIIECDDLPSRYHADIVKMMIKCDSSVVIGMEYDGKQFYESTQQKQNIDLVAEQYAAIDAHIAQCIKSNGWDYDNIGEIAAYAMLSETYKVEARAIWAWVEECHAIQTNIKNGVVKYDSVGDALDALPAFDVHA